MSRIQNFFISFSLGIKTYLNKFAMKKLISRSKKKRLNNHTVEKERVIFKSLSHNTNLIKICRWKSVLNLTKTSSTSTQLTKRCIITGRKNIFNKHYKLSRILFLKHARIGSISGLVKATW